MGKILIWPIIMILFFGFLYVQGRLDGITIPKFTSQISQEGCGEECKKTISNEVAKAVATLSGQTKTQTIIQSTSTKPQVSYITLDGSGSTQNLDWVDVPGIEVAFDLNSDYGKNAKVSWEASLKVADGNGQAFARLFDTTHKIAVSESEITTSNNTDYSRVNSGYLNLWAGRNTYRVQIKSLNSFVVSYTGGRIRLSY